MERMVFLSKRLKDFSRLLPENQAYTVFGSNHSVIGVE